MNEQYIEKMDFSKIIKTPNFDKFKILMEENFSNNLFINNQKDCIYSGVININNSSVKISFYNTGNCVITASSKKISENEFNTIINKIKKIAISAEDIILLEKSLFNTNIEHLLNILYNIDLKIENNRWIIPIISVIIIEIMVITKFNRLKLKDFNNFKKLQLSKKLEILNKKISIPYYKNINEIRELRNSIVHDGEFNMNLNTAKKIKEIIKEFCLYF
ncbi:MAG: hypothetical protein ACTSVV_05460 [Promethearchaeota archaeon]